MTGRRAVIVRPGDEQAERFVRQCVGYCERHGLVLVAIADSAGAMGVVASGGADVVVAARASHVEIPPFVEIVADEAREPDAGPRQRRAQPTAAARHGRPRRLST